MLSSVMPTGRRIALLLAAMLAMAAYWATLGLHGLALRYCHGSRERCARGLAERMAAADEALAIGSALFVLLVASAAILTLWRARRRRR